MSDSPNTLNYPKMVDYPKMADSPKMPHYPKLLYYSKMPINQRCWMLIGCNIIRSLTIMVDYSKRLK